VLTGCGGASHATHKREVTPAGKSLNAEIDAIQKGLKQLGGCAEVRFDSRSHKVEAKPCKHRQVRVKRNPMKSAHP
jgi:hypothetical protein